jgi:hypothetical protein
VDLSSSAVRPSEDRPGERRALPAADLAGDPGEQLDGGQRLGVAGEDVGGGEAEVVASAKLVERARPPDRSARSGP